MTTSENLPLEAVLFPEGEHHGGTLDDAIKSYWSKFAKDEKPNILAEGGVHIAKDSGLSDVDELLYCFQFVTAGMSVAFIIANIYMIFKGDLSMVFGLTDMGPPEFLLSSWLVKHWFGSVAGTLFGGHLSKLVPLVEWLYLVYLIGLVLGKLILVNCSSRATDDDERKRWMRVSQIFWDYIPQLTCFSAMRLLYFVTPTVVSTQAYVIVYLVQHRYNLAQNGWHKLRAVMPLVKYIALLAFAILVGLDSFLVKYRMAERFINQEKIDFHGFLGTVIFLTQVLGVVNLNWFVRERLFIFIFGGEDGNLDSDENARIAVWNAILAKKIYTEFGPLRGTIVMLGFDDYDFQSLVLDDANKKDKMRGKSMRSTKA